MLTLFIIIVVAVVLYVAMIPLLKKALIVPRTDQSGHVMNSEAFFEVVDQELHRLRRNGPPFSLLYLNLAAPDLDRQPGEDNKVLRKVAGDLPNHLRETDLVARIEGDKLAVFLPDTGQRAAPVVMNKIKDHLAEFATASALSATFDMVVITCDQGACTLHDIDTRAEELMSRIRTAGKSSQLCVLESHPQEEVIVPSAEPS